MRRELVIRRADSVNFRSIVIEPVKNQVQVLSSPRRFGNMGAGYIIGGRYTAEYT